MAFKTIMKTAMVMEILMCLIVSGLKANLDWLGQSGRRALKVLEESKANRVNKAKKEIPAPLVPVVSVVGILTAMALKTKMKILMVMVTSMHSIVLALKVNKARLD